ncbi:hypothetical protein QBC41DRAFT_373875 [Cercophora samala]|uniref:Uncharacterized protein n=1 Tax=Cercophora samala TaxID=330535 RepID=A0AA39ZD77_9PEZI|nr:hypothetical protein QBC41DRAFT_373875 [Cercophora samala]
MTEPQSEEAIRKMWDFLLSIDSVTPDDRRLLPPVDIDSQTEFPEAQYGELGLQKQFLLPVRNSEGQWLHCWIQRVQNGCTNPAKLCVDLGGYHGDDQGLKEVLLKLGAAIPQMGCFKGMEIQWNKCSTLGVQHQADVCFCALNMFESALCCNILEWYYKPTTNIYVWYQFWQSLLLFSDDKDGSGLGELRREGYKRKRVKEEATSQLPQALPKSYPSDGTSKKDALKEWMDHSKMIAQRTLVNAQQAAQTLLDRKNTLEDLDTDLRWVLEVCAKMNEILHKLRESARTMESLRAMVDDDGMQIPLPANLELLRARGGMTMIRRMCRGIAHLEDAFDPWAIDVQTELREVTRELEARNRDIKEFQDGLVSLGKATGSG